MIVTLGTLEVRTVPVSTGPVKFKLTDLGNWYSSPRLRNQIEDMPDSDGAFDTERSYRGAKSMSLQGMVLARSIDEAEEEGYDIIAGLAPVGELLDLKVESGTRTRYMKVRVTSIDVVPFTANRARFMVGLVAADGRKYGPLADRGDWPAAAPSGGSGDGLLFPLMGVPTTGTLDFGSFSPTGLIELHNGGKAPSWPIWHAIGGVDGSGFQIVSGTDVIEFSAALPTGVELILDPYAGGRATIGGVDVTGAALTRSEWVPIMPGETRRFSFDPLGTSDGQARLLAEFREAWW